MNEEKLSANQIRPGTFIQLDDEKRLALAVLIVQNTNWAWRKRVNLYRTTWLIINRKGHRIVSFNYNLDDAFDTWLLAS